jgi:hypothetical protein
VPAVPVHLRRPHVAAADFLAVGLVLVKPSVVQCLVAYECTLEALTLTGSLTVSRRRKARQMK